MLKSLQKFGFRDSHYQRPQQDWQCGRSDADSPCQLGPNKRGQCQSRSECVPRLQGQRWLCTRVPACEAGALPDGSCCQPLPPCMPRRTVRARRRRLTQMVLLLSFALLLLLLAAPNRLQYLSPGHLSLAHSSLNEDCTVCHSSAEHDLLGIVRAAFNPPPSKQESQLCLNCHQLGDEPLNPHGLAMDDRVDKRSVIHHLDDTQVHDASAYAPYSNVPYMFSDALLGKAELQNIACINCHTEHHGREFGLAQIDSHRCQSCHNHRFEGIGKGHPEFTQFPYARRTRIHFDHNAHFGKYFSKDTVAARAPKECGVCHSPDLTGQQMHTADFETACASCHAQQIAGAGRAGEQGITVFSLPGLDSETLEQQGYAVGDWPVDAEDKASPFLRLLLKKAKVDFVLLDNVDLLDLHGASPDILQQAHTLAWAVKSLLHELEQGGQTVLHERLDLGETPLANAQRAAMLPAEVIQTARQAWFPHLTEELKAHRSGQPLPTSPLSSPSEPTKEETEAKSTTAPATDEILLDDAEILGEDEPLLAGDEDEILLDESEETMDGDILGGDEEILLEEDTDILGDLDEEIALDDTQETTTENPQEVVSPDEWVRFGGWYRRYTRLYYRPTGHADVFLKAWLDLSAQYDPTLFAQLSDPKAPGLCSKCHSVDATENNIKINWLSHQPAYQIQRKVRFSHTAHFGLLGNKGCLHCHIPDPQTDYAKSFTQNNPQQFVSNFKPMQKQQCAVCHNAEKTGEACLICHNYHLGTVVSEMPYTHVNNQQ